MKNAGARKRAVTESRKAFAHRLVELRRSVGFTTAYAFFHQKGGAKSFGVSYQQYLRVERGVRLPSIQVLSKIADALGHPTVRETHRTELAASYLRALTENDQLFDSLFGLLEEKRDHVPPDQLEEDLLARAVREAFEGKSNALPPDQSDLLTSDLDCHLVFDWLRLSGSAGTDAEIADSVGRALPGISSALKKLAAKGLVKQGTGGEWSVPEALRGTWDVSGPMEKTRQRRFNISGHFQQLMLEDTTRGAHGNWTLLVDSPEQLTRITQVMMQAMYRAALLGTRRPSAKSRLASIEYRVGWYRGGKK